MSYYHLGWVSLPSSRDAEFFKSLRSDYSTQKLFFSESSCWLVSFYYIATLSLVKHRLYPWQLHWRAYSTSGWVQ